MEFFIFIGIIFAVMAFGGALVQFWLGDWK